MSGSMMSRTMRSGVLARYLSTASRASWATSISQPSYCRAIRTRFVRARSSSTSRTRIGDPSARYIRGSWPRMARRGPSVAHRHRRHSPILAIPQRAVTNLIDISNVASDLLLRPIGWVESPVTDPSLASRQPDEGAPDCWLVLHAGRPARARGPAPRRRHRRGHLAAPRRPDRAASPPPRRPEPARCAACSLPVRNIGPTRSASTPSRFVARRRPAPARARPRGRRRHTDRGHQVRRSNPVGNARRLRGHRVEQPCDLGGCHVHVALLTQGAQRLRNGLQVGPLLRMGDEIGPN